MGKPTLSAHEAQTTLADEIRASEQPFVEAVTAAVRERMTMEYYRLRGYAVESGQNRITLRMVAVFDFNPDQRTVRVETIPEFVPEPGVVKVRVGKPKPQ